MKKLTPKVDNNPLQPEGRLTADEFNQFAGEVENAILASGQALTDGDVTQLATAIAQAGAAPILQPVNIDPGEGAIVTTTTPTLIGSEFFSLYGKSHLSSRFRIYEPDGTTVVYDSGTIAATTSVIEGIPTTRSVLELAVRHGVEMPIVSGVASVLFDGTSPAQAIEALMTRPLHDEVPW